MVILSMLICLHAWKWPGEQSPLHQYNAMLMENVSLFQSSSELLHKGSPGQPLEFSSSLGGGYVLDSSLFYQHALQIDAVQDDA